MVSQLGATEDYEMGAAHNAIETLLNEHVQGCHCVRQLPELLNGAARVPPVGHVSLGRQARKFHDDWRTKSRIARRGRAYLPLGGYRI